MAAPTLDRHGTDRGERAPGPAQVRAAIVACGNDLTVSTFDTNMDEAYRESPEALRKFLDYWWGVTQVALGKVPLPPRDKRMTREEFIAAWEERNGRPFPRAA